MHPPLTPTSKRAQEARTYHKPTFKMKLNIFVLRMARCIRKYVKSPEAQGGIVSGDTGAHSVPKSWVIALRGVRVLAKIVPTPSARS